MTTRRALMTVPAAVFASNINHLVSRQMVDDRIKSHGAKKHPDAELLALCAHLAEIQAEWQRLWDATPRTPDEGPTDHALEGLRAKAAAILAMEQAGGYTSACQCETGLLLMSLAQDAAGSAYRPVGDASTP